MDLTELRPKASAEIDSYRYEVQDGMIGNTWTAEKVEEQLQEFRSALIEPYWADVVRRDTAEQMGTAEPSVSRCAIAAEDANGMLLAFDPAIPEFLLVRRHEGAFRSFGVNGDAVGCFMAR